MFIALFLFVGLLKDVGFKEEEKNILNYTINVNSPKILVRESKASYSGGYIKGFIFNDTGEHIKDKFIQFDFYNSKGHYVGTESKEIKYFNVNEKINYDVSYSYKDVDSIEISFVDEVVKKEIKKYSFMDEVLESEDFAVRVGVPIGLLLVVYVLLP